MLTYRHIMVVVPHFSLSPGEEEEEEEEGGVEVGGGLF